jgi:RimJ/RimL family protein N-acetyltransferase
VALQGVFLSCYDINFLTRVNRITAITAITDFVSPNSIFVLNELGVKDEGMLREYGYWKDSFRDVILFRFAKRLLATLKLLAQQSASAY